MQQNGFFNYDSPRSKKARMAHHWAHKDVYWLLFACGWIILAVGVVIVWLLDVSLGWLVAGLAGPFLMCAAWSKYLMKIPPSPIIKTIDDVLDADILGILPREHSPQQLAGFVTHVYGGRFMMMRLGLGRQFLEPLSSTSTADTKRVWDEAEQIRQRMRAPTISSATLTAALVRVVPAIESYLARIQLDPDDIIAGAAWYEDMERGVALRDQPHHDGGIGRDWSFGYTPLLTQFGFNLSEHASYRLLQSGLPSRDAVLLQVMNLLAQGGRSNVALVGGLGSGKSSLVQILARKMMEADPSVPRGLHYHQVIALDPSTLISSARGRGELEQLVQHLCYEAIQAKNTVLFLDDAQLFFEDGNGAVNLSNVLMPLLESGAMKLVMAMDEQRWLQIVQHTPAIAQHINRIMVQPTDERETMRLLEDQILLFEYRSKVTYTYQSLATTYRLSSRFLGEQVMPGRAIKVLEAAADFAENGIVTHRSVEQAIERTQGVKVTTADSDDERQTLLNLEDRIHERMINQTRAVQVVSDALRRARAGVRNEQRPIGTFLFLGPTGVGKTELAKSVAAVFFGGEDHLARIDLNEYSGAEDVNRLIADAAQDQHSLTAQIARNPFSVVLLDEIEKAHPNVLNTLLQMLDEGILRDINNREVSFRDAVVIATSNAGAERIREHIEKGEQLQQFEEEFTNELISANVFRPEFLNRFDEIVLFRPLKPEELVQVIDIILKSVNKNLSTQKVSVTVDEDAKRLLVDAGYDPRLGARPMRRVVQRVVENIVANQMLSGKAGPGAQIRVAAADVQTMLQRGKTE
ncbi:MAG TPA: AAA family ATPase [Patescibacteria group bacterium]|nr:AAA family ATPase [Patescibacteria group bacterium]